jgi:catechol 2,3-dioxygenase-like lactoylglutathione lyase family enzyme
VEGRPSVWIGHTVLTVGDVDRSADYWQGLGMREVERNQHVAVLELRGGTHLVLVPGTVNSSHVVGEV